MTTTTTSIRAASRVHRFTYAIRQVVAEAKKVEATGMTVRYLNIGDPNAFGFLTPPHLIEAAAKAMRDGHNGYTASAGILPAREAAAADFSARGVEVSPDRVLITSGTSEGIELALTAIVDEGDDVLVPSPTYPLYTAVLAKIGATPVYYRTDPARGWLPDLEHMARAITPKTRALVLIDPNNPTGAIYPEALRRQLIDFAVERGLVILADEVYGDLGFDGSGAADGGAGAGRADHFLLVALEGLSRARLARRLDGRGRHAASRRRAGRHQEARRRAAVQPRPDAIRRDRGAHRRSLASGRLPARAQAARRPHRPRASTPCPA